MKWLVAAVAMAALWAGTARADRDSATVYVFGNSLVHHLDDSREHTNVPHWLAQMARADGRDLTLDGGWGSMARAAESLPARGGWEIDGVPRAARIGDGLDTVIVTPLNYIQNQLPAVPYQGNNSGNATPLGSALAVFDWAAGAAPGGRLFVYEGWSVMGPIAGAFPPDAEGLAAYHAYNQGDYSLWFRDLIDGIETARPDLDIGLIPVASVLAEHFAEGGLLAGLPPEVLYTDDAPHGTTTLYFLAAMVTYAAVFEAPPPAAYTPPDLIDARVTRAYPQLARAIWEATPPPPAPVPDAVQTQAAPEDLPPRQAIAVPAPGQRPADKPALGMEMSSIADWTTQHPFIDIMKTARPWVGQTRGEPWGAYTDDALRAAGHVGADGWPRSVPPGVDFLEAVMLTGQNEAADHLRGDYVVLYDGEGEIELTGRARRVRPEDGRITFSYTPGSGYVGVAIRSLVPDDPIRNIRVMREDHLPLHDAGVIFNPDWIARIEDLRALRFMDWMATNNSEISRWNDRPRVGDATYAAWGVPVEIMVALANHVGADPWFTMPHLADDDYVRNFATLVRDSLDPRLKAHVEYSNEVWNGIFRQSGWARAQAEALWGPAQTGWMQFYGLRAAQVMDIWTEVFGDAAQDRLLRVVATHTGWPGLEESILEAPLAFLTLGRLPVESFDAYAITGYFGHEMGGDDMAQRVDGWIAASEAAAQEAGRAQGLSRVALREFVAGTRYEAAFAPLAQALAEGSLNRLVTEIFPYHAGVAASHGLQLVMYEGGSHLAGQGERNRNEALTGLFTAFSYSREMAQLYETLLQGWVSAGGTLFSAYNDVGTPSQWGSWGALRHLDDANPRWDVLMAYNATAPNNWDDRPDDSFDNGITRIAGSGNQRLQGTSRADILIAGAGSDTLVSGGGDDHLHGGAGSDRAVLPGARADFSFDRDGPRLVARGPQGRVILVEIETVSFEAAPAQAVSASAL